jgi:N-acylneuraminate cytidylyltransferase
MKVAVQIPIKGRSSTRVPNKNFRDLAGKPLCFWFLDEMVRCAQEHWDLFIDSEDPQVFARVDDTHPGKFAYHKRDEWFAGDQANGNHLIQQFAIKRPQYDLYVQAYVTAVTLKGEIVREVVEFLENASDRYDSVFLVTEETGWVWYQGEACNYAPDRVDGLPRSQDAVMHKETTGLYAIARDAVLRTGCRIGRRPYLYTVEKQYALDVDTMEDFWEAQKVLDSMKNRDEQVG